VKLDETLASSRQAVAAIEAQMHTQHQESSRLLNVRCVNQNWVATSGGNPHGALASRTLCTKQKRSG
jgi:hypothetical protein